MEDEWTDTEEAQDGLVGVGIGPPANLAPGPTFPPVFLGDGDLGNRSPEDVVIATDSAGNSVLTGTSELAASFPRPRESASVLKARDVHEMRMQLVLIRYVGFGFVLVIVAFVLGSSLGWYSDNDTQPIFFQTTMASLLAAGGTIIGFLFGQSKSVPPVEPEPPDSKPPSDPNQDMHNSD